MRKRRLYVSNEVRCVIENQILQIEGPLGKKSLALPRGLGLRWSQGRLDYLPNWRLRKLEASFYDVLKKAIRGVHQGFVLHLDILGVGYKAEVQDRNLRLKLGKSEMDVVYLDCGLDLRCPKPRHMFLQAAEGNFLRQTAANIRSLHPPEVYKQKGIFYRGEESVIKQGKVN